LSDGEPFYCEERRHQKKDRCEACPAHHDSLTPKKSEEQAGTMRTHSPHTTSRARHAASVIAATSRPGRRLNPGIVQGDCHSRASRANCRDGDTVSALTTTVSRAADCDGGACRVGASGRSDRVDPIAVGQSWGNVAPVTARRWFVTTGEKWWTGGELNSRHRDFQSRALPTELPVHRAGGPPEALVTLPDGPATVQRAARARERDGAGVAPARRPVSGAGAPHPRARAAP
jgi:hypothetical protein